MALGRITYEDKQDYSVNEADDIYKIKAKDMNEIKKVFNDSAEQIEENLELIKIAYQNLGDYKVENGVIYFMKSDGTYNEQGITLAGQSTILDGQSNPILNGLMTPQDNLLTNSDFKSGIINQKGQTTYNTIYKYGIDMWYMISTGILKVNENSISVSSDLKQFFYKQPENGDYTFTISISGTIYKTTLVGFTGESKTANISVGGKTLGVEMMSNFIVIYMNNNTFDIDFMKLEKGLFFTGMPTWNKTLELLKCKSKFKKLPQSFFGYGMGNYLYIITDTEDMDKTPSVYRRNTGQNASIQIFYDDGITDLTLVIPETNNLNFGKGYLRVDIGRSSYNNWRFTGYFKDCDIFADSYDY